jgi:hypothetical protein
MRHLRTEIVILNATRTAPPPERDAASPQCLSPSDFGCPAASKCHQAPSMEGPRGRRNPSVGYGAQSVGRYVRLMRACFLLEVFTGSVSGYSSRQVDDLSTAQKGDLDRVMTTQAFACSMNSFHRTTFSRGKDSTNQNTIQSPLMSSASR